MNLKDSSANLNVLRRPLEICSCKPQTGWFRDGYCKSDSKDYGHHSICCIMTARFLNYSKAQGNDLLSPQPSNNFPGLTPGDKWCICAERWNQAYQDGLAPPVVLEATNITSLEIIKLDLLLSYDYKKITY